MYVYNLVDQSLVNQRVQQFRDQVRRRLSGELSEEEFKPLRLMNGLYLQLHAYMLRVAIPYGTLSSKQMRALAHIAVRYDKGYGHFTTRQNLQFNWPKLKETPDILADLADVQMHAFQTSGNCIRNVTADQYAGVAVEEIADPRITAEVVRQWSTLHPEFSFLPRKFKIAVTGSKRDRAAVRVHDIGLIIKINEAGEMGYEVIVGGGLGRTPIVGVTIREFLPQQFLLSYLESILRIYNQIGRRDNIYKARIKIVIHELGAKEFTRRVEKEWKTIRDTAIDLPVGEYERIRAFFAPLPYQSLPKNDAGFSHLEFENQDFSHWVRGNTLPHRQSGYSIANISLKPIGGIPGDASAKQMEVVADLAEKFSFGEIRVAHEQNLVLPHVKQTDLYRIWNTLKEHNLATPNLGLISDIIACPGMDYCSLATARSIPLAQDISNRFSNLRRQNDIGELSVNISGCINACGHHHVGHIGLLGVDRKGEEYYQVTIGGSADENASIGEIIGPAIPYDEVVDAIERVVETYVDLRAKNESFIDAYRRVGKQPFKENLYVTN